MKRLNPSFFTEMPWRNGKGVAHEIAKETNGDDLLWRISTARVESNGRYSKFDGLTRLSAVVEGNGIRLFNEDTGEKTVVKPPIIARLPGDNTVRGDLLDGGIRHLNLVFDEKRVRAQMKHLSNKHLTIKSGDLHAIYCVEGSVEGEDGLAIGPGEVFLAKEGELSVRGKAIWIAVKTRKQKTAPPQERRSWSIETVSPY